jgi:adenylate kinase
MASKKLGIKNRDELRKIKHYERVSAPWRRQIFKDLVNKKGNIFVDTHASIKAGNKYTPGILTDDLTILGRNLKAIIYVDADTKSILARRSKDAGTGKRSGRENDMAEEIKLHRQINLAICTFFSVLMNIPLYTIENEDGRLAEAQNMANEIARNEFGK